MINHSCAMQMPDNTKRFVYLIGASKSGPVKIGTTGNIARRRSVLNVSNPQYLRVLYCHEFTSKDEAARVETALHYRFRQSHIRGEWFQLSESDFEGIAMSVHGISRVGGAPDGWSLSNKVCDEFTADVCAKARNVIGLTREKLADLAHLSAQTVASFEDGNRTPQLETIEAIRFAMESKGVKFVQEGDGKPLKILA